MRSASGKSRRSLITAVGTIARLCRRGLRTVFADNVVALAVPATAAPAKTLAGPFREQRPCALLGA
jgi:ABC-type phosphate transport system auxiliary subunit